MDESTLVGAVLRYFRRYYCEHGCMWYIEPVSKRWDRPDLLFIQTRRNVLHIFEAEPTLLRAFSKEHGFTQLRKYKGNYKWLILPDEEVEKDVDGRLDRWCSRSGIGLLSVSGRKHFWVWEIFRPRYIHGDFLKYYPEAEDEWITG